MKKTTWTVLGALALASGCSAIVDGAIRDRDAGMDGSAAEVDCAGAADGTTCGGGRICVSGGCAISRCGDGVVDSTTGEECDDANQEGGDGCEPGECRLTCSDDADCDDGRSCNGEEQCTDEHVCTAGEPLGSGDDCAQGSGEPGVCRGIECVPAGCGNGVLDDGEQCDDGNDTAGDGCESDCTYSCEVDDDCDDADVCTGTESCDVAAHSCVSGTTLVCDDGIPCTSDECDADSGCVYPLIDMDGDGYASDALGPCGTDCNDMRADVNPGAPELCGDALDSNCDGNVNPTTINIWYLDCDGDGYAPLGAASVEACNPPPPNPCGGGWTERVPLNGNRATYDCNDGNAIVRPSQTTYYSTAIAGAAASVDYDYDCNAVEERRWTVTGASTTARCTESIIRGQCVGTSGWTGTVVPVCGGSAEFSACEYNPRVGACARTRYASRAQQCR